MFGGVGGTELLLIVLVALLVLGPEHLPRIMRTVGKFTSEFRRISTDIQRTINAEINLEEHNQRKKEAEKEFFGDKPKKKKKKAAQTDSAVAADAAPQEPSSPAPEVPRTFASADEANASAPPPGSNLEAPSASEPAVAPAEPLKQSEGGQA